MRSRVLVIDDDPEICELAAVALRGDRDVVTRTSAESGLATVLEEDFGVLLCDLRMPGLGGAEVISRALDARPDLAVILLTGDANLNDFAALLRLGVLDFLLKPFRSTDLRASVERAEYLRRMRTENARLEAESSEGATVPELVMAGEAMREVGQVLRRVAPTEATVLVTGESGTGKEVVARALHELSPRASGPFVSLSCAALSGSLLESELFGHARGAFTDAHEARRGSFEAASGGTLLLDEIGAAPPEVQVRLLRVVAEREVTRVGEARPRPVDVRVVAATNADLADLVARGRFREDLRYRLDVVRIQLPPLRDRARADLDELAGRLLARTCARLGRRPRSLTPAALDRLSSHSWPGNVRELENTLERAVILAREREVLDAADITFGATVRIDERGLPALELPAGGVDLDALLGRVEERLIDQALARTGGHRAQAAALLGLQRTALVEKLRRRVGAR